MLKYSPRLIYKPRMRSQSLRHAANNIVAEDETTTLSRVASRYFL